MARAIQDDPEMFHGLTIWGDFGSAQVRDNALMVHISDLCPRSTEDGRPAQFSLDDARKVRDLLNIATARGYL